MSLPQLRSLLAFGIALLCSTAFATPLFDFTYTFSDHTVVAGSFSGIVLPSLPGDPQLIEVDFSQSITFSVTGNGINTVNEGPYIVPLSMRYGSSDPAIVSSTLLSNDFVFMDATLEHFFTLSLNSYGAQLLVPGGAAFDDLLSAESGARIQAGPHQVPDTGSTAGALVVGLAALGLLRRRPRA